MILQSVTSERLNISMVAETELRADLDGKLPTLGPVAADWPPLHWDSNVVKWSLAKLAEHPSEQLWRPWFIRLRGCGTLIGTCGFKGPPDSDNQIEIGYSVVSSQHRRGIASEAVRMLLSWAWLNTSASACIAYTLHGDPASGGVLRRNGFAFIATFVDPTDGTVDRLRKIRC